MIEVSISGGNTASKVRREQNGGFMTNSTEAVCTFGAPVFIMILEKTSSNLMNIEYDLKGTRAEKYHMES